MTAGKQNKTVLDWICSLPEPNKKLAIMNMFNQKRNGEDFSDSMHDALANAFKWDATPEEHEFWETLQGKYFKQESK
jgi:hypothetical protein